jgi:hypothetical protein
MHYVTSRTHQMQKHNFSVTCLGVLFMETARAHPSIKNSVSTFHASDAPECTRRSHRMQNDKFGVTCLGALFVEFVSVPPSSKNYVLMFHGLDAPE